MDRHRLHGTIIKRQGFIDMIDNFDQAAPLTFLKQEELINAIPNNASVNGSFNGVSQYAHFSHSHSKYRPTSMRNKILYHWNNHQQELALSLLFPGGGIDFKRKSPSIISTSSTKSARTHVLSSVDEHVGAHSYSHESESTPYFRFMLNMIESGGTLKWRIHASDMDVIAMNGVSLDAGGKFQHNQFIHMFRRVSAGKVTYSCICEMYQVLLRSDPNRQDAMCVHIKFFTDCVEPIYQTLFSSAASLGDTPIYLKVQASLPYLNVGAIRLDNSKNCHRFSVISGDMQNAAILTMNNGRVSCLNGRCIALKGRSRKVVNISNASNCEHLHTLGAHSDIWSSLIQTPEIDDDDDDDDDDDNNNNDHNENPTEDSSDASNKVH